MTSTSPRSVAPSCMPLPHASLPLSFSLLRNGRRESTTPCLDVTLHGCQIHRILDPEFREPFISCSRIFAAGARVSYSWAERADGPTFAQQSSPLSMASFASSYSLSHTTRRSLVWRRMMISGSR